MEPGVLSKGLRFGFPIVTAMLAMAAAHAQTTNSDSPTQLIPRTAEQREQLYRAEHRILLNVVVADAAGKPLAALSAGDFSLLDNGKARAIATVAGGSGDQAPAGMHATLVIDALSSYEWLGRMRKELAKFLSPGLGPLPYPVNLAVLTENGVTESALSTDRATLAAELNRMTQHVKGPECDVIQPDEDLGGVRGAGSSPSSSPNNSPAMSREQCNNDKLVDSINFLQKLVQDSQDAKGPGILIWLGPGWPIPSAPDAGQILPGVTRDNFAEPIAMLLTELREADVTLDAVSWSEFKRARGLHDTGASAVSGPTSIAELSLPALVSADGGQASEKSKSLADAIAACLADGQNYYTISFDATPSAAPDEFHRVEVKVDKPGAAVRTATAYYAQP